MTRRLIPKRMANVSSTQRNFFLFAGMAMLLVIVGVVQSWNVALSILNMCLISSIMALGLNIQWGFAGLFNVGVMGFAALGGLAGVVVSMPPVGAAWAVGGLGVAVGLAVGALTIGLTILVWRCFKNLNRWRYIATGCMVLVGYILMRAIIDPSIAAIEAVDSARSGYLSL